MIKKIFHESGTYYLKHRRRMYSLHKNLIGVIFGVSIERQYDTSINNQDQLINWIKIRLDIIGRKKMDRKSKKDFIRDWDGYTSNAIKRDKKIDKII